MVWFSASFLSRPEIDDVLRLDLPNEGCGYWEHQSPDLQGGLSLHCGRWQLQAAKICRPASAAPWFEGLLDRTGSVISPVVPAQKRVDHQDTNHKQWGITPSTLYI